MFTCVRCYVPKCESRIGALHLPCSLVGRFSNFLALGCPDFPSNARDLQKSPSVFFCCVSPNPMAPLAHTLLRDTGIRHVYSSIPHGPAHISSNVGIPRIWNGPLSATSVDLVAMVVSDSGLASADPEWWNSSIFGCVLMGLQPRGGWQIMQRTVQWGRDSLVSILV
jgi:hypothetical protein